MSFFKRDDPETRRAENEGYSNLGLNQRTISIIGLVVLGLIVAALFVLPRLGGGSEVASAPTPVPQTGQVGGANTNPGTQASNVALGTLVAAANVDRDGCPVNTVQNFRPNDNIYVVAPNSAVPAGTSIFVRLYHDGQVLEDAPEIRADQNYNNTCINFVFESVAGGFAPGLYEAEFFVNGNAYDTVRFEVR
jgi:hypothetical protein